MNYLSARFKRICLLVAGATLAVAAACVDEERSGTSSEPLPPEKATEAARPTPTPIAPAVACPVEQPACDLGAEVSRLLEAGRTAAVLDLARPVEVNCAVEQADPTLIDACAAAPGQSIVGFTLALSGKTYRFVDKTEFADALLESFGQVGTNLSVISIGCSAPVSGARGSCADSVTLAVGNQQTRGQSPVVWLFYERDDAGWSLVGIGGSSGTGTDAFGGPAGRAIAGRDSVFIWFNPGQ